MDGRNRGLMLEEPLIFELSAEGPSEAILSTAPSLRRCSRIAWGAFTAQKGDRDPARAA